MVQLCDMHAARGSRKRRTGAVCIGTDVAAAKNMGARLLSCLMALALVASCCMPSLAFAQAGDGGSSLGIAPLAQGMQGVSDTFDVSDDTIVISTKADLEAFRNAVNIPQNGGLADKTVQLACDIDLDGSDEDQWTPIGFVNYFKSGRAYSGWGFGGVFDGCGHTISGLYIDSDEGGQALFGFLLTGATVENLVVKGTVISRGSCVAGVVASAALEGTADTIIKNVGNEVNVTSMATGEYVFVGGVLAYAEYESAVLSGCYNKGSLTASRSTSYVGGISGWYGTISDCYNLGDITVDNSNSSTYAGGIIGSFSANNGSVARSYSNGSIALKDRDSMNIGGVAGGGNQFQDCFYNPQKVNAGVGGTVLATGVNAYGDAVSLLQALQKASGSNSVWADGTAVNVLAGGTPALAWESRDIATYGITRAPSQNGTFSTSYDVCTPGATVKITPVPDAGYVTGDIKVVDASGAALDVWNSSFVMPASKVTVAVTFVKAPAVFYRVDKAAAENGSFTVSSESALVNTRVKVAPAPAQGYELGSITVTTATGAFVAVADGEFVMPAADVQVSVTFKACVYLDARVTVKPESGQDIPQDLECMLEDRADGSSVPPVKVVDGGGNKQFQFRVVDGHVYDVRVSASAYKLSASAVLEADERKAVSPSLTVQLMLKPVNYTVTFDPASGAFPSDAGMQLVDGCAEYIVSNGSLITPPGDPRRDGYVFAGWFDDGKRFLSCDPVASNASYKAAWVEQSQVSGDTFLLDLGSGSRDGSYALPYRISSERDLRDFACIVNGAEPVDGSWKDIEGRRPQTLAGAYVSLESDITMVEDAVPVGIGSALASGPYGARPFSGTFLGNNHVIDSFAISARTNPEFGGATLDVSATATKHIANSYSALFGALAGATVQDVTVKLAGDMLDASAATAGLAALVGNGSTRIGHCAVQGDIVASDKQNGVRSAGGLVAVYAPESGALSIDHCYHVGSVSSTSLAGGIIGSVFAAGSTVRASFHVGDVVSSSASAATSVGAFIGGAGAESVKCSMIGCVTEQDLDPVGKTAAGQAMVTDCRTNSAIPTWASSTGDGGIRSLLGDEYFDFTHALACGAPSLKSVLWTSGYRVVFVNEAAFASGNVPSVSPQDAGCAFLIPACDLKRAGYELVGWQRAGADDGEVCSAGDSFTMPSEDVTFLAQWKIVKKAALTDALFRALSSRNVIGHVAEDAASVEQGESFVTPSDDAALEAAMASAQKVRANQYALQAVVDAEAEKLNDAVDAFEAAVRYGSKAGKASTGQPAGESTVVERDSLPDVSSSPTASPATSPSASPSIDAADEAQPKDIPPSSEGALAIGTIVRSAAAGKGVAFDVRVSGADSVTLFKAAVKAGASVTVNTVVIDGATFKVTAIAANAFKGCKATSITIGKNVTAIGKGAFQNAKKLKKVTLGKNVKTIGKNAFKGCKKLKKVTIGKNVKTVGKDAFKGCKDLKKVTLKTSKLAKSSFKNLAKGSSIKTVKLSGVSKKAKRSYKKWAEVLGIAVG